VVIRDKLYKNTVLELHNRLVDLDLDMSVKDSVSTKCFILMDLVATFIAAYIEPPSVRKELAQQIAEGITKHQFLDAKIPYLEDIQ
jgi:hypothetical protein